jgi:two-component system KDP operon response regulator KdpE
MIEREPLALLVEDDSEIRCHVRAALQDEGWQVREAASLASALADARTMAPDLIVLDLGMPDGDSVAFIATVRLTSPVPVIVLAARVDDGEKYRAMAAGASDYLSKLFGAGARFTAALRRLRPQGECS